MKLILTLFFITQTSFLPSQYKFPQDHFAHNDYQTEWWYYTGHIKTEDNKEFGYELTFFKVSWPEYKLQSPNDWIIKPIYLAHFAISDKNNKKFYYDEKLNRPIGEISGASLKEYYVWNEDWSVKLTDGIHYLSAQMKNFEITLKLTPTKLPVIHGVNGISLKGKEKNNFSFYYSITRLNTEGKIKIKEKTYRCDGISWMDHEWMNNRSFYGSKTIARWDWFSLQLNNNTEIMFYILRDKNQNIKSVSSGSIIYSNGVKKHLFLHDVNIKIINKWKSPKSKGVYPIKWNISIPKEKINLTITPFFKSQELNTKKT
ncbi:MAG: carotenoid 1,2-hydratase, partial [Spirochaetota bacterium]|nr:carotenoid 1,2-hydratase [Spirochaetota bacterium]